MSIADIFGGNIIQAGIEELGKWSRQDLERFRIEREYYNKINEGVNATNTAEATTNNLFIAGWRPSIGYTFSFILIFNYIVHPLMIYVAELNGITVNVPILGDSQLMTLISGMLGLSGMRTYDKIKGVGNGY